MPNVIFLNNEWAELRKHLTEKRIEFDKDYRERNQKHSCKSKVYAYTGRWFCEHLSLARAKKFNKEIKREQEIIRLLISQTKQLQKSLNSPQYNYFLW